MGKFYHSSISSLLFFIVFSTVSTVPCEPSNFIFTSAIVLSYFSFHSVSLHCTFSCSHTVSSLTSYHCFVFSLINISIKGLKFMARCWIIIFIFFTAIFFSDEYSSPVLCFSIPFSFFNSRMAVEALSWILSAKSSLKMMTFFWTSCPQEANAEGHSGMSSAPAKFCFDSGFYMRIS